MQLLYGNDGINYRTIDKSPEMTGDIERAVLGTYVKFDFARNPRVYSSVEKEPESITYVTSNLNLENRFPREQLILCKTGHMQNFSSPSYYFHGLIEDVDKDFFKKDFFNIFGYTFIRDRDLHQYYGGRVDSYQFTSNKHLEIALTNEQLIVILAMFMNNESNGKKTKILCDARGDDFNQRSREILYSIYRYLPYGIRRRYGFTTYIQDERKLSGRVSFVVFCRDDLDGEENGFITLQETRREIASIVKREYLDYAQYLVEELDEKGREEHFEKLDGLASEGKLRIKDCVDYYSKIKQWSSGTQEQLLPEWIQYIDQNSFRKGPLYEMLLKIIVAKVNNDYYNDYLFDQILRPYHENLQTLSPQAAKTMRFADCLEEIFIDPERFHEWYRETVADRCKAYDSSDPDYMQKEFNFLKEENEILRKTDIMCDELTILLEREIKENEKKMSGAGDAIEEQADQEKHEINLRIHSFKGVHELSESIAEIVDSIRYDSNRPYVPIEVDEWLETNLLTKSFSVLKDVEEEMEDFEALQEYASVEMAKKCLSHLQDEQSRLILEKQSREFYIKSENILDQYNNLVIALSQGQLEDWDDVSVVFGEEDTKYKVGTLKAFFTFILNPSEEMYAQLNSSLKQSLIELGCINGNHAEYLISDRSLEKSWKEKIIDFYLKSSPVIVSGIYLANLIDQYCDEMADDLIVRYGSFEKYTDEKGVFVRKLKGAGSAGPSYSAEDSKDGRKKGLFGLFK